MKKQLLALLALLFTFSSYSQLQFFSDPEPLDSLNSVKGENYIFFDFDNSIIYYTRERHPDNANGTQDVGDIWMSAAEDDLQVPLKMKVNDKNFASPIGMTADGQYFLYNYVWYDKGLYYGKVMAQNQKGKVQELEIPYFKNRSPLQTGSISNDGKYLFFSLENNLGYGVDDLFVCFLGDDGKWSSPRNLGNTINSKFQEISPFLAPDNKTLYYASNGQGGQGSFDIFYSVRQDDTWQNWSQPVNLGATVNTSGAETSFVFSNDSDYAYFVSTQNSDGYGDIKRIKIQANFEEVAVDTTQEVAFDIESGMMDYVTFELHDKASGELIAGNAVLTGDNTLNLVIGDDGVRFDQKMGAITVEFKSEGYFSYKSKYDLDTMSLEETYSIALDPLKEGSVITLSNVLFYRGTANFIEGSEDELDLVVEMMEENPTVNIFLKGHTDNVGNAMLNVELSQERVYAVTDYLVSKGIESSRIDGEGYGGEQPVASNTSENTRKLNRRVEFEIVRVN
ncbi:OmpA family protein [Marinoscillum pacificum]|uniref:OmpA family protein n=1 Tax=Marinoscillum pacificum TaxID=392723 RepID=UPI002157B0DD|nr:OmpA family protein [Marinoscillum pacificum]